MLAYMCAGFACCDLLYLLASDKTDLNELMSIRVSKYMSKRTMARDREVRVVGNLLYRNAYTWWIPPDNAPPDLFPCDKPDVIAHILVVEARDQFTSGSAYSIRYDNKSKEPHLNIDVRWFHGLSDRPMIRECIYPPDHIVPYSGGSTPYQILEVFGFPSSGSYGAISNWRRRTQFGVRMP